MEDIGVRLIVKKEFIFRLVKDGDIIRLVVIDKNGMEDVEEVILDVEGDDVIFHDYLVEAIGLNPITD